MIANLRQQLAKYIDDEGVVAELSVDIWNSVIEEAYMIARHGTELLLRRETRSLYWKGRCDAARDVRKLKVNE